MGPLAADAPEYDRPYLSKDDYTAWADIKPMQQRPDTSDVGGDVMKLQIKITPEGIIEDAKFKTFGCGSAIASSSLITEWVKGKTLDEAMDIKNTDLVEELSLPPVKIHCSVLAEEAIREAIEHYKQKQ